jgi:serine/threonine-protein kinase HipA
MTTERKLQVLINTDHVANLFENNGLWRLEYTDRWLNHADNYALAPSLPLQAEPIIDSGSERPVQWFFDNLLPEEMARALLAKEARVSVDDAFALLELVGGESAGAITLLHEGETFAAASVAKLSHAELSQRIRELPRAPMNKRERKRMSLAGAQHKMLVVLDADGQLYEPIGQTPSTHILKPEHERRDDYWFTVRNEWFTMTLADRCGLNVAHVEPVRYVPEACYLVRRFDRSGKFPQQQRVHVVDACQLLGMAAYRKYRDSTVATLRILVEASRAKAATALALYRWLVFNYFVGNGDAHLKNLSFSYSPRGIGLLPHYDLLSTVIYERVGEHEHAELSQPLGNARYFGDVTRADLLAAGEKLGLSRAIAAREIDRLAASIGEHSLTLIAEVEAAGASPGELRMLRQIHYLAIQPFTTRM